MPQIYEIYEVLETGERLHIDNTDSNQLKEWLLNKTENIEHLMLVKESGHYIEMIAFGERDWDIIDRGINIEYLEEKKSFRSYKRSTERTVKHAGKDKPMDQRKHHLKSSRGINRKRQSYIPIYRQLAHKDVLPTAQNVLKNAKKSSSGIWKLSGRQVAEISQKYKFNPPTEKKSSKHLGSTGIIMWRRNPKDYYLVKFSKHERAHSR